MAAVPHVSSAESLFDPNSAAFGGDGVVTTTAAATTHSVSGFSTSMCLDFQDKYALERSLPSYSSNFGSSSASWEHHNASNSDTHFFTSNSSNAAAAAAQGLTMQPHLSGGSSHSQHELLSSVMDWQQMGDLSSGFGTSAADGQMVELIERVGLGGLSGSGISPQLLTSDGRSGWNSVDAGFISFANGNAAAAQAFALVDEDKAHIRSDVVMPLRQSDITSKLPVVETKVEASVDTSGAKSMQETSQASIATGRKRRTSSDDRLKDVSCVTSSCVKNGDGEEVKGKRQRNGKGQEQKQGRSSSDNSGSTSPNKSVKENAKPPEPPKDYIHVRARRGQATDSHSLAERVRREKISERMKFLQDLVPGCNKVTGKAMMLDEIINYVQSLQRQVEFLSMKLAAVNPRLEFNIESLLGKEIARGSPTNFVLGPQSVSYSQQLHHAQHGALQAAGFDLRSLSGLQEAAIRRGTLPCIDPYSDPVSQKSSVWDGELQNIVT